MKLDNAQLHLLRLTAKGSDAEGWAKVSGAIWPFVAKLPDDLVERRPSEDGGHVRLTDRGEAIIMYS